MRAKAAVFRALRGALGLEIPVRYLGLELACRADDDATGRTTSRELAEAVGVTERTVERWLAELARAGWFIRKGRRAWQLEIPRPAREPDKPVGIQPDARIGIGAGEPDARIGTSGASRASDFSGSLRDPKTNTKIRQGGGAGEGAFSGTLGAKRKGEFEKSDFGRALNGELGPEARRLAEEGKADELARRLRIGRPRGSEPTSPGPGPAQAHAAEAEAQASRARDTG